MRKTVRLMLIVLLIIMPLHSWGEDTVTLPDTRGHVIEIPFEKDQDPKIGPHEEYYQTDENGICIGYEDPSISVHLERGTYLESTWLAVRVKIAGPGQIRTEMSCKYGAKVSTAGATLAKRVKAVFAINGDFFMERKDNSGRLIGLTVRQGHQYRKRCNGKYDVLIIDDKGDFHIIHRASNEDIDAFEGNIINSFTFGPALVENGEKLSDWENIDIGMNKRCQRMAICQTGPLEYLCICCEDNGNSKLQEGLTIAEFQDLIMTFDDVKIAYNLDGGTSSSAVFKYKKEPFTKVNSMKNKTRTLGDIIYFADAYVEE